MQSRDKAIRYGIAALLLFGCELVIGMWLNDWHFVRSYLGDVLVIPLIYCLIRIFTSRLPRSMPALVGCIGIIAEITQYFRLYAVLGFEKHSLPAILLGTSFSWWDIVSYAAGVVLIYLAELAFSRLTGKHNEAA